MAQRRSGCGCLLGLVFLGALAGGPTFFGKTEDTVQTTPAGVPTSSSPSSSVPTGSSTTLAQKTAAPNATRVPLPPERAPKTTAPTKPPRTAVAPPPVVPEAEVPRVEVPDAPPSAYYPNCTAARAAGAAPLLVGEPGYRPALDRDKDGVACET